MSKKGLGRRSREVFGRLLAVKCETTDSAYTDDNDSMDQPVMLHPWKPQKVGNRGSSWVAYGGYSRFPRGSTLLFATHRSPTRSVPCMYVSSRKLRALNWTLSWKTGTLMMWLHNANTAHLERQADESDAICATWPSRSVPAPWISIAAVKANSEWLSVEI